MLSYAWLIVWLPLFGFVHNALAGFLYHDLATRKRAVSIVAPLVVLASFAVTIWVLRVSVLTAPDHRAYAPMLPFLSADTPWISFSGFHVNFALLLDPLSMLMAMIVTSVGGLIHIYATGYMADDAEQPRFFTYFNLFIFMMLVLVLAENFLLLFVGWEGVGTCSYLLISFWYTDADNAKAGNKAFIVNRVGDLGFSLGMMAIWSVFGTLSFFTPQGDGVMQLATAGKDAVGGNLASLHLWFAPAITTICILLFIGATGKSAQIPLTVWLPDAMAGPTPVSALIHAATMVTAGVVMLTRCSWLFVHSMAALQIVGIIGLATAFMGATIGLVQNDIKRVLAFSTVSQLGYMVLACGVGSFSAAMFHVTTHAFFKALLFLGSGAVIHSMLGEQDMRKMGGLKKLIPRTWFVMFIGTYAIAGFPLLSGFWSKDAILDGASRSPWGGGVWLYLIGLGTTFLTAFYMNRLMWKTFYTEPRFRDGELVEHHHSNADDHTAESHEDAHGAPVGHEEGKTPTVAANASGTSIGHSKGATLVHASDDHGARATGTGTVAKCPPSMMWPLYILAALSVLAGILLGPTGIFDRFLKPSIAPMAADGQYLGLLSGPYTGYVISSIVVIAGLVLAATLYSAHKSTGELQPEAAKVRNPVYNFLVDKWEFDRIYNAVFIRFGGYVADHWLWKIVDMQIIDNTFTGLARAVGGLSVVGRKVQTGYVRNYALAMLLGVVILVAAIMAQHAHIQHLHGFVPGM